MSTGLKEQWVEVEEFPDYAVSNFGEISNIKTGMPRRLSRNQGGIMKISIYRGKELHTRSVAVMVAEAFVEGQSDICNTPIHLDGDRTNCAAHNLAWRPRWYAVQFHRQFDTPAFYHMDVKIQDVDSGVVYNSVREACIELGLYYNDVYKSYLNDTRTPVLRHKFRLL